MYSTSSVPAEGTDLSIPKKNRKRKRSQQPSREPKKPRVIPLAEKDEFPKSANAIIFARSRMFYSRPARSLRGNVIFGLRKERTVH